MAISDGLANQILNSTLAGSAWTAIATSIKLGLHTAAPGAAGTANEVTGGSYARANVTFAAAAGAATANSGAVSFAGMPAGTVTHVSIWSQADVFLFSKALTAPQVVNAGGTFQFPDGDLDVTITSAA